MRERKAIGILVVIIVVIQVPTGFYLNLLVHTDAGQGGAGCIGQFLTDSCNLINTNVPASPYNGTSQLNLLAANNTAMNGTIPSYAQVIKQK
ncbi:MAG TPA: hypothetical protein VFF30_04745 [Nitrososphaerales archaeon]|nr:hypothetical protein [Nitrososphaerales archaeon]